MPAVIGKLKEIFSLDYRSLALMRVGFGILIILDLLGRARSLVAHYTDAGVVPRFAILGIKNSPWFMSLHMMSGTAWFEGILFILAGVFAIFLILGYQTKLATIVSWFFLMSLHTRNPAVVQGGDVLFRVILFWAMFLPWGRKFSLDELRSDKTPKEEKAVFSAAAVAFIIQAALIYVFSGLLKSGLPWTIEGTAIQQALRADQFTTALGYFLLQFPLLLKYVSFGVLYLEMLGPLLFLFPVFTQQARTLGVAAFAAMQVGINLSMRVGFFGSIATTTLLGLLPSWFWDVFLPKVLPRGRPGLEVYYDGECGFCKKAVFLMRSFLRLSLETKIAPADSRAEIFKLMAENDSWVVVGDSGQKFLKFEGFVEAIRFSPLFSPLAHLFKLSLIKSIGNFAYARVAERRKTICSPPESGVENLGTNRSIITGAVIIFLVTYVIFWNMDTLYGKRKFVPQNMEWIATVTGLGQEWNMFSPNPIIEDGWYVIPGRLADGTEVDLFKNGGAVSFEKPKWVAWTYLDERWRKYMMNIWAGREADRRLFLYGRYLCRHWNETHAGEKRLNDLKVIFMLEKTLPNGTDGPVVPTTILAADC